ncbi:GD17919 [Drosophila simulans]|uniref:GD17919 n=1 Tax=Drosophila simulans TaxID=7240 RepID=B4QPC5_DROSI|nr:GD17919 [Drosophila simulans]
MFSAKSSAIVAVVLVQLVALIQGGVYSYEDKVGVPGQDPGPSRGSDSRWHRSRWLLHLRGSCRIQQ